MKRRRQGFLGRLLLRLLPPDLRRRHGAEVLELLEASLQGRPFPVRIWLRLRTTLDVLFVGTSLRLGMRRPHQPPGASSHPASTLRLAWPATGGP